jgi:DNA primase large subunit
MNSIVPKPLSEALSFYTGLPLENINYESFKAAAIERLKILKKIEANIKDFSAVKTMQDDLVGHYCLRLVCAHSKASAAWFVSMESLLFKYRLDINKDLTAQFFSQSFFPHLSNISELNNLTDSAARNMSGAARCISIEKDCAFDPSNTNTTNLTDRFKIHFTKCSDLLAKRTLNLEYGYVLADKTNLEVLKSFMYGEFKRFLGKKVDALYDQIVIDTDERLLNLNRDIFSLNTNTSDGCKDVLDKFDSYPLCIQGLISKLKMQRHLKYADRQTLSLFFKDVGLPMEDTIFFFRSNFNCSSEQFNKDYLYAIRHNYGLEGKKGNYSSYSCPKMFSFSNDASAYGCPFIKHPDFVRAHSDIEDLTPDAARCCSKLAAKKAGKEVSTPILSPADYFRFVTKK